MSHLSYRDSYEQGKREGLREGVEKGRREMGLVSVVAGVICFALGSIGGFDLGYHFGVQEGFKNYQEIRMTTPQPARDANNIIDNVLKDWEKSLPDANGR